MITDVKVIFECVDKVKKHYRLAITTYGSDLFTKECTTEILECAPQGQATTARLALMKTLKATKMNILKD